MRRSRVFPAFILLAAVSAGRAAVSDDDLIPPSPSQPDSPFRKSQLSAAKNDPLRQSPEKGDGSLQSEDDPWKDWEDDTAAFREEAAATVNGVPVLNGLVIDRYAGFLSGVRKEMQEAAKIPNPKGEIPTPKTYVKYRAELVQRDLPACIQKTVLVQYLMAGMTREQRIQVGRRIDKLFEKEIERLKRELNASNLDELERELGNRQTAIQNLKESFALDRLSVECMSVKGPRFVPVSDGEILKYYETHTDQFEIPQTAAGGRDGQRKPIDEVRDEIRDVLAKEQNTKRSRQFLNKVFSAAKIESSYSLPKFIVDESPDDSE